MELMNKDAPVIYDLISIINHLHVTVTFATITSVLLQECW